MTTHILSMTYGPKIAGVRDGTIRQTIRRYNPKRPFVLEDKLIMHTWAGKPYRSPWDWRMNAEVVELDMLSLNRDIWMLHDHYDLMHEGYCTALNPWEYQHDVIDKIAKADGIVPPTGLGLKEVLESFHGAFGREDVEFQVIRW